MAATLAAYNIASPENNGVQAFQASQTNAINQRGAQMQQEAQLMEQYAQLGLGVMGGNPDGEINQQYLAQALDMMGDSPLKAKLQENPELLRTITKGSLNVLKSVRDEAQFEMAKKQFEADLAAAQAKATAPIEVSPGASLYDPATNKLLATAPKPESDTPANDQKLLAQINEERAAAGQKPLSLEEFLASKKGAGLSVTTNPDGTVSVTQGGAKLTEAQGKDIGFYTRGLQANQGLAKLEGELTDFWMSKSDLIPLGLGNYAKTPEFRQAKVEADNFLAAILRKDTGAAITDKEFDLYGPMFLPIPGDDDATINLKRQKRATALLAIKSGLGTAEAIAASNEANLGLNDPMSEAQGGGGASSDDEFDPANMSDDDLMIFLGAD